MRILEIIDILKNPKYNVHNKDELIANLLSLDKIVGAASLKNSIVKQIIYLLQHSLDGVMLNTVLYGPPGTGKTKIGKLLCEMWKNIGVLKPVEKTEVNYIDEIVEQINTLKSKIGNEEHVKSLNKIHDIIINKVYNPMYFSECNNIVIVSREDFIGLYQGHTTEKTHSLLTKNLGKVVFIDEAYSLMNADDDMFGMEALTTLNLFMSEHPNDIIIIFAGYKELMEKSIFRAQPGLQSRCTWVFEIEKYTSSELKEIFLIQMKEDNWELEPFLDKSFEKKLNSIFDVNNFPGFGRDTKKLLFYSKLDQAFSDFINNRPKCKKLSITSIENGLKDLKRNQSTECVVYQHMYI